MEIESISNRKKCGNENGKEKSTLIDQKIRGNKFVIIKGGFLIKFEIMKIKFEINGK